MGLSDRMDRLRGMWRLCYHDTFAGESRLMSGRYRSRARAERAARRELKRIEKLQPTRRSGGSDGIQDRIFIVGPDGRSERVR